MATEHHTFTEQFFPYSSDELRKWNAGDQEVVASLVEKSGLMGRRHTVYENQTKSGQKQNYPEVLYAGHLIAHEQLSKERVFFENFRLSHRWLRPPAALRCSASRPSSPPVLLKARGRGPIARNTSQIRKFLSEGFGMEFDRLYCLNKDKVGKTTLPGLHVDLFAWWPEARRAEVIEIKKYDAASKREDVEDHQLCFLSFVESIAHRLGDAAFVAPGWSIHAKIIALVPSELHAAQRVEAETHSMTITV